MLRLPRKGKSIIDQSALNWRRTSECGTHGACVEVAYFDGGVAIRDSKLADSGPVLCFSTEEAKAFFVGVRNGEFDTLLSTKRQ